MHGPGDLNVINKIKQTNKQNKTKQKACLNSRIQRGCAFGGHSIDSQFTKGVPTAKAEPRPLLVEHVTSGNRKLGLTPGNRIVDGRKGLMGVFSCYNATGTTRQRWAATNVGALLLSFGASKGEREKNSLGEYKVPPNWLNLPLDEYLPLDE